ncbi:hypothetical protein Ping_1396 [Psychromonas ingrahamii 37]|uniref:Uncharacterized protein n=1 Tax=Psychromonas ingrahamii (strain DSM 17664 / CCUG 51855 / 37) TaxID=357804 RepID=A1SUP9_PSYIN|nr:hypothetical protein [Psychromonas ingrahamii]ABM03214.1 hypothetical protein Ping_1396 [Psychromonas ingrahamii 37]
MTDIKVNKEQWDAVSADEQQRITEGLIGTGVMQEGDRIIGSDSEPKFDKNTLMEKGWNPLKDICKAGCDVAAGAALGWCTANTVGVGLVACIAAAEVARRECKKHC